MRILKYLIPLWAAVAVYSLLSFCVGARGVSAYDQLRKEWEKQKANLETLKNINQRLEGDKDALLYDSDIITAYARELGYGAADERLVRIVGLSGTRKPRYTAGQVLIAAKQVSLSNRAIQIISLLAGLIAWGGVSLFRLMDRP